MGRGLSFLLLIETRCSSSSYTLKGDILCMRELELRRDDKGPFSPEFSLRLAKLKHLLALDRNVYCVSPSKLRKYPL